MVSQEQTRKGVPGPEVRERVSMGDREEVLGAEQEQGAELWDIRLERCTGILASLAIKREARERPGCMWHPGGEVDSGHCPYSLRHMHQCLGARGHRGSGRQATKRGSRVAGQRANMSPVPGACLRGCLATPC